MRPEAIINALGACTEVKSPIHPSGGAYGCGMHSWWHSTPNGWRYACMRCLPADSIDLCLLGALSSIRSVSLSIAHVTFGRVACPAVLGR